ncbi:MAG: serine/threonine protein kinase, partial [Gemmatimonadales bacterium]|nr:serine/threonine protein kinase [Gemmatimonadales bacterium]
MSEEDHWELHEQLADALAADAAEANVLSQQLGLPEDEASDVAAALAALGAATAFDDPDPLLASLLGSGEKIGDYEVLERVGRGGFGVVYRARDPVLNVDVALKLIPVSPGVEDEVQERFAQEARAVARLDHPNIVRVRTAGWDPRGPFLVMDFAPGESLQHRLEREGPLPPVEAVAIARQLAEALDHAHEHGVVHRDVKPDNVIVTPDGLARLTDFGLARDALAHGDSKVSRAGHALGTPGYWPPEQARGDLDAIGPASDVYGLGATLYALLTGRPPFEVDYLRSKGYAEIQRIIREEEPTKPSTKISTLGDALLDIADLRRTTPDALRRLMRADLDWIVMRAMEKERTRRYDSPRELCADIERHLKHEPVMAGPPSNWYRSKKFLQRHRTLVAMLLAVVLALVLGIAVSTSLFEIQASKDRQVSMVQSLYAKGRYQVALGEIENSFLNKSGDVKVQLLHAQLLYNVG